MPRPLPAAAKSLPASVAGVGKPSEAAGSGAAWPVVAQALEDHHDGDAEDHLWPGIGTRHPGSPQPRNARPFTNSLGPAAPGGLARQQRAREQASTFTGAGLARLDFRLNRASARLTGPGRASGLRTGARTAEPGAGRGQLAELESGRAEHARRARARGRAWIEAGWLTRRRVPEPARIGGLGAVDAPGERARGRAGPAGLAGPAGCGFGGRQVLELELGRRPAPRDQSSG